MRTVAAPGRWVWGLSGLVTIAALAIPGARLITSAGVPDGSPPPQDTVVRTVTVPQPVASLDVQSYGAPVQVTAGPVRRVQVTETIWYDPQNGLPAVTQSVSDGRLTLGDPVCNMSGCSVGFTVTVPPGVAVTAATGGGTLAVSGAARANLDSGGGPIRATRIDGPLTATTEGGPMAVSGAAGANLDSGGGPIRATRIDGSLTATTEGGWLALNGLTGPLYADTGGGPVQMQNVAAATATVITGGGPAQIGFTAAPDTVVVSTDGGPAALAVPGGPYALTADSDGGPELVGIATNPAAQPTITITTGGGPLQVESARA
jgi:hypothetical protein